MPPRLDAALADRLLAQAVTNVQRDYPVYWPHLLHSKADLRPQRELHPIFAGAYDWHSCVHQTWLIVRLLRVFGELPGAAAARGVLDRLITPEHARVEAAYFARSEGAHWERPYGWAWLLLLEAELRAWPASAAWAAALRPLGEVIRQRWLGWLATARRPVRVGTHANSAFALGLGLDAARSRGDRALAEACRAAAERFYSEDPPYGGVEPDAADFLSPALVQADLWRRLHSPEEFAGWFAAYLPGLAGPRWRTLREPVEVDDAADPHGSHLAGLALSRAWCWRGLAEALPAGSEAGGIARHAAERHAEVGWTYVFGHGYAAEHWLGTFAAYLELGALSE